VENAFESWKRYLKKIVFFLPNDFTCCMLHNLITWQQNMSYTPLKSWLQWLFCKVCLSKMAKGFFFGSNLFPTSGYVQYDLVWLPLLIISNIGSYTWIEHACMIVMHVVMWLSLVIPITYVVVVWLISITIIAIWYWHVTCLHGSNAHSKVSKFSHPNYLCGSNHIVVWLISIIIIGIWYLTCYMC
jgi:hypothetical protein